MDKSNRGGVMTYSQKEQQLKEYYMIFILRDNPVQEVIVQKFKNDLKTLNKWTSAGTIQVAK